MAMIAEASPILESQDVPAETSTHRSTRSRVALVAAAALATAGLLFTVSHSSTNLLTIDANPQLTGLSGDPCSDLPYVRIMSIKSNNLGGKGPDTDAEEGIIYRGVAHHLGLENNNVEIHVHAVSHVYMGHSEKEGAQIAKHYEPQWPKVNGITGHFGTINVQPGTNVTVVVHGYDPQTKQNLVLPKFAMTFFDLDTGVDGKLSVEFLKIQGFAAYYVTNETEINITKEEDGSTRFQATVEGSGDDNPDNPLILTKLQKNRAVSFEFHDTDEVLFQVGCSPGHTARVFQFVVRPIMRCAKIKLEDGTLAGALDPVWSPVALVKGDAYAGGHPFAGLAAVFAFVYLRFVM